MTQLIIRIQSLDDAKNSIPLFDDINSETDFTAASVEGFGILEGGMQSGKTSIMFKIRDAHGKLLIAEMPAEMFQSLNGALMGAEQRFSELKAKRN